MTPNIEGELNPTEGCFTIHHISGQPITTKVLLVAYDALAELRGEQKKIEVLERGIPRTIVCSTDSMKTLLACAKNSPEKEVIEEMVASFSKEPAAEVSNQAIHYIADTTVPTPPPPISPRPIDKPKRLQDTFRPGDFLYGFSEERESLGSLIYPDHDPYVAVVIDQVNNLCGREALADLVDDLLHLIEPEVLFRSELRTLSHAEKQIRTQQIVKRFETLLQHDTNFAQKFDNLVKKKFVEPFTKILSNPGSYTIENIPYLPEFVERNKETLKKFVGTISSRESMKLLIKSCAVDTDRETMTNSVTKRLCKIGLDLFSQDRSIHFILPEARENRSIASVVANFINPIGTQPSFRYTPEK